MRSINKTLEEIKSELKTIQENGVQADRKHLKQNMHTQFADPFEFAREYVVNSYDALATECYISGRETEDTVTVTIRDNGKGMNYQRLQDYFKIFRSRKDYPEVKAIGRFGVGKMSVAAVPGLLLLSCTSSTGDECWRFETDNLTEDRPVKLERIEPVSSMGTKFEITFKKRMSLKELLDKIYKIVYKYVRFLNINVHFDLPVVDKNNNPVRKSLTKGLWQFDPSFLGKTYQLFIKGSPLEVVMGTGNSEHELYQNKVYITSNYNLLFYDQDKEIAVPNLTIRVNSEIFELTFGRHCLSNESVLKGLAKELRGILPSYYDHLMSCFNEDLIIGSPEIARKIEDMTIGLLDYRSDVSAWNSFPLFNVYDGGRISFHDLEESVLQKGVIYVEAEDNEGADYSMFDAIVLKQDQPDQGLEMILKKFGQKVINLNLHDTVIEIPQSKEIALSKEEKNFEKYLTILSSKEVLDRILSNDVQYTDYESGSNNSVLDELEDSVGICEEAKIVERDINALTWKVNYLVERDGKTPCYSRKFHVNGNRIVLNLYHSEIREFIELSCIDARLSAHWAMAMCLSDQKLLPHITPDAREDILLFDAMSRINNNANIVNDQSSSSKTSRNMDFIRSCKRKYGSGGF